MTCREYTLVLLLAVGPNTRESDAIFPNCESQDRVPLCAGAAADDKIR